MVNQLRKWGARKILIVNGHGHNTPHLEDVARQMRNRGVVMPILEWWRLIKWISPELERAAAALPESVPPGRRARTRGIETAAAMVLAPNSMPSQTSRVIYSKERWRKNLLSSF